MQSANEYFPSIVTDGQHLAQGWGLVAGYGIHYAVEKEVGMSA